MWPFSALKAYEKTKQRDNLLSNIHTSLKLDNYDLVRLRLALFGLYNQDHLDDELVKGSLTTMVDRLASIDIKDMTQTVVWMLGAGGDKELNETIASNALTHIYRTDDKDNYASIAMLSLVISGQAEPHSKLEARAVSEWDRVVGQLETMDLSLVFGAASNAAIPFYPNHALQTHAIETWSEVVKRLASQDPNAAAAEITRVADGYEDFGEDAMLFRNKASELRQELAL